VFAARRTLAVPRKIQPRAVRDGRETLNPKIEMNAGDSLKRDSIDNFAGSGSASHKDKLS
jgi:hypothetical protein